MSHRIVKIKEITSGRLFNVWFPIFTVTRQDGQDWTFSEADFKNMELDDFPDILNDLKNKTIRPLPVTKALDAVKRFMKCAIKLAYITDLQMGIENNWNRVNLLKPDQRLSGIEDILVGTLILKPELGIVYKNATLQVKNDFSDSVK